MSPDYDANEIEERLAEATRSWTDNLYEALIEHFGEERGTELFHKYRDAFPPGYRDGFLPRTAVADVARIEELESEEDIEMSLYHPLEEPENFLGFKLFRLGEQTSLSGILPLLEDMGVEVVDERPHKIEPAGSLIGWIYDWPPARGGWRAQTGQVREIFQEAFARAWRGTVENDGFNRLVLRARLTWRQVTVLRAYRKYLRQAGTTFSQNYAWRTPSSRTRTSPACSWSSSKPLGPSRQARAEAEIERLREIEEALEEVVSLDEDRILRNYRTSPWRRCARTTARERRGASPSRTSPSSSTRARSSCCLCPAKFEIFVYSPMGVHLRGGRVARGGIRWSDRGGFRTEVLGLEGSDGEERRDRARRREGWLRRQTAAHSGRPRGAPGRGHRLLQDPHPRHARPADNLAGDSVVPPEDVVRYDEDDPYLVVANRAATFSDIANGISEDYGSGSATPSPRAARTATTTGDGDHGEGRVGVGERHFRELGMDIQNEDFTVAGIGDMSGDVLGGSMLLSRHIKLVVRVQPPPHLPRSNPTRRRASKSRAALPVAALLVV